MKRTLSTLIIALLIAGPALAQDRNEVQLVQSIWHMEKKEVAKKFMQFTEVEAAKFWPIYDAYSAERQKLGADRIAIIGEYVRNYKTMTNETAENLTNRIFKNDMALTKLQKKYYNRFKKAVSPLRASQFWQLETYMDTEMKSELQHQIPILGELEIH